MKRVLALPDAMAAFLFDRRVVSWAMRREHVLCLGDSHAMVMSHVRVPGAWFRVRSVLGATASGILNPASKTRSREIFAARLERAKPWQRILLMLGEVDCGFVIWRRAERHGLSVEQQLEQTLENYERFIADVRSRGFAEVIVVSAPLPTIRDYPTTDGLVARQRATVTASQRERTQLTLRYNAELRERCERAGATFVDVTSGHTDPASGLVDARFVRPSERDHHLVDAPFARLIAEQLRALWSRDGTRTAPPAQFSSSRTPC